MKKNWGCLKDCAHEVFKCPICIDFYLLKTTSYGIPKFKIKQKLIILSNLTDTYNFKI